MNVHVLAADRLTPEQRRCWSCLQRAEVSLHSPFFRPEFTQLVAAVQPNVEVAVLEEHGEAVGFFPFQRAGKAVAKPVAGPLSDFHGVVAREDAVWTAEELLRGCGLATWRFHNLLASQRPFGQFHYATAPAPYMDLSGGFPEFHRQRRRAGSQQIDRTLQKSRKIAREVGPLHFEPHTSDPEVLETLIRWKVEQYRRRQTINYLSPPWTVQLLQRLLATTGEALSGMLSVLRCGGRIIAAHFGLRSYEVLHSWFPVYDPEHARYSPGMILFVQLAQAAASLGIQRIDLGKGDERFKTELESAAIEVAEGAVDFRPLLPSLRRRWFHVYRWIRRSPLRGPGRLLAPIVNPLRKWAAFG